MAPTDRELRIKVEVDSDGAIKKFQLLDEKIKDADPDKNGTSSGFSRFQATLVSLNQATQLASSAFSTLGSVAQQVGETISRGFKVDGLSRSFDNLQASVGAVADESIAGLREATKGMISDFELMQQANQAVLLGVDDGTGKFNELAEAAVSLGQATGRTATEALTDLTTAIGRGSVLIADNLGIQVKASEAQRIFAESIGTTVDALTDQQKSQALSNAIATQAIEKARELAGVQEDAGSAYQALSATIQNARDQFAATISSNTELGEALRQLQHEILEIDFTEFANDIAEVAAQFVRAAKAAVKFAKDLAFGLDSLKLDKITHDFGFVGESAQKMFRHISDGARGLEPTEKNLENLEFALKSLQRQVKESGKGGIDIIANGMKRAEGFVSAFAFEVNNANKELDGFIGRGTGKGGDSQVTGGLPKVNAELERLNRLIKDAGSREVIGQLSSEFEKVFKSDLSGEGLTKALEEIVEKAGEAKLEIRQIADALQEGERNAEKLKQEITDFGLGEFNAVFEGVFSGISDEFAIELGSVFSSAINTAINGGDIGASIGSAVGGIVGSIFGPIGSAVGAQLGGIIGETFVGNIEDIFGGNASEAIASAAFVFIDTIFFGLGSALDAVFGGALEQWVASFGSNNRATDAKRALNRFFDSLFDGIQIFQNGEFSELLDFDAFDYETTEAKAFFESLTTDAQGAFNSIGFAFDQFSNDVDKVGDVAAITLGNVLQGDLFNLKLALDDAGISVEELGAGLQKAALDGKVSFLEAQGAINDLGVLAEDGIPGKIGAVGEAFEKMKQAGVLGGKVTVASLQAIAAEAKELEVNDLPGLKQALIDAGASEADVDLLIGAMEKFGFSIDDVVSANKEDLIPLLAELEAQGFGFAEKAAEQVDELVEKLDKIPDNLETEWTVRVRTIAEDSGAEQYLDSGGGRAL